jgi:hypothetical protein
MPVLMGCVGGRARDALGGQQLGDRLMTYALQVEREDPLDDRSRYLVNRKDPQSVALLCLPRIRMRSGFDDLIAVPRAPALVLAVD